MGVLDEFPYLHMDLCHNYEAVGHIICANYSIVKAGDHEDHETCAIALASQKTFIKG